MIGRKKLLSFVALLSVLLIVPLVFSFGVVDVSQFSLGSSPSSSMVEPASPGPTTVFVDPVNILDDTKQSGSLVSFHVNVSDVTDLFTWQVNVTWDTAILNFTRIVSYGDFLAQTTSLYGTSRIVDIVDASNDTGYAAVAETILGEYPGITGSGRLLTIEFLVVGYGSTDLTISISGTLSTMLLDSAGSSITYGTTDGYFRNKYPGDVNGDYLVGVADFSALAGAYGSSSGQPTYDREADFNLDDLVGVADFSTLAGNYGKTFP